MIWIIVFEIVFWVLHYANTQNTKYDFELLDEEFM